MNWITSSEKDVKRKSGPKNEFTSISLPVCRLFGIQFPNWNNWNKQKIGSQKNEMFDIIKE